MRALSLWQPYASLIAAGVKKVETRGWQTDWRGPLAIHAAKKRISILTMHGWAIPGLDGGQMHPILLALHNAGQLPLPFGAIVCTVRLLDCVLITPDNIPDSPERECGDYTPGRFAWLFTDLSVLEKPVPINGMMGLWEWWQDT